MFVANFKTIHQIVAGIFPKKHKCDHHGGTREKEYHQHQSVYIV